ncbi:MAG: hypothetical protein MI807_23305 [Verrucomicrobiales bacterium]|nr:hypothetical protein [Verrucomicrobiales bacterium]
MNALPNIPRASTPNSVPVPPGSAEPRINSSALSAVEGDFGSIVLKYSCDDSDCYVTESEFELVEFDSLFT